MKVVFLRGMVPKDRSPKEIMYDGLDGNDDMWEHLACAIGDERCEIVYWGGNRIRRYSEKDTCVWVHALKHYEPDFIPDAIIARGGFEEYDVVLKRFPETPKIYYGAGDRKFPGGRIKYDAVMVDSERQLKKGLGKGLKCFLWAKPAAPIFRPIDAEKEYDVCFVGDGRFTFRAKIKNVDWVYASVPSDLKVLHLGWSGRKEPPKNVTVRRVQRHQMPAEYAKCRVGIVPYTSYDSAPRTLSEMSACGLPVVVAEEVHYNRGAYPNVYDAPLSRIFEAARAIRTGWAGEGGPTIRSAAEEIRRMVGK